MSFDHHDNDSDPSTYQHRHGTRCSGVVGAARNDHCGVGVAYECNLGGSHNSRCRVALGLLNCVPLPCI